ncbi:hypothetical protein PTSG_03848 [Salpingoeca rosetta]|uniref:WW domain-containing protein n=1 Tax=Salpingoeca rosetta (strain ATCC 50818 / BSB-021) TaxID=946362 RepID=F2U5K0_SALR5|nr:uncharacterized protein PTSG_03848 [Salpingoeca rosetta]EGD83216.1 hypothetical protein PTSG_03848 [Salpingoeca rosetta]|eukprot:XP_004995580.1 hypothetical protein PTSG_03848 [Salpingoeca rosetta]
MTRVEPSAAPVPRAHAVLSALPLPAGWEARVCTSPRQRLKHGQRRVVFLNHERQMTTWHDPRLRLLLPPSLHELPHGWTLDLDAEGEPYFLDDTTCSTCRRPPFLSAQQHQDLNAFYQRFVLDPAISTTEKTCTPQQQQQQQQPQVSSEDASKAWPVGTKKCPPYTTPSHRWQRVTSTPVASTIRLEQDTRNTTTTTTTTTTTAGPSSSSSDEAVASTRRLTLHCVPRAFFPDLEADAEYFDGTPHHHHHHNNNNDDDVGDASATTAAGHTAPRRQSVPHGIAWHADSRCTAGRGHHHGLDTEVDNLLLQDARHDEIFISEHGGAGSVLQLHDHMRETWPLPCGWSQHTCSQSGQPYFVHASTRRVTWTHPSLARELAGVKLETLPLDWDVDVDEDGLFFVNHCVAMATREPPAPLIATGSEQDGSDTLGPADDCLIVPASPRAQDSLSSTTAMLHSNSVATIVPPNTADVAGGEDEHERITLLHSPTTTTTTTTTAPQHDTNHAAVQPVREGNHEAARSAVLPTRHASLMAAHDRAPSESSVDSGVDSGSNTLCRHTSVSQSSLVAEEQHRLQQPATAEGNNCNDSRACRHSRGDEDAGSETSSIFSVSSWASYIAGIWRGSNDNTRCCDIDPEQRAAARKQDRKLDPTPPGMREPDLAEPDLAEPDPSGRDCLNPRSPQGQQQQDHHLVLVNDFGPSHVTVTDV